MHAEFNELRKDLSLLEAKLVDLAKLQLAMTIATNSKDIEDAKERVKKIKQVAELL